MKQILKNIKASAKRKERLLAVLIDPDKFKINSLLQYVDKINESLITHIFVGGSIVQDDVTQILVSALKKETNLPIVLFPGDVTQISKDADALLFLSLISGRNSNYLIGKHVESISVLNGSNLEVIPTGYILIESGTKTAVQLVTGTLPLKEKQVIIDTAKAGELLGMQLIYLEAGSGAKQEVSIDIIRAVKQELNVPLIVGGGIKTKMQLENAYESGADLVVIGTAFEENKNFFAELKK